MAERKIPTMFSSRSTPKFPCSISSFPCQCISVLRLLFSFFSLVLSNFTKDVQYYCLFLWSLLGKLWKNFSSLRYCFNLKNICFKKRKKKDFLFFSFSIWSRLNVFGFNWVSTFFGCLFSPTHFCSRETTNFQQRWFRSLVYSTSNLHEFSWSMSLMC